MTYRNDRNEWSDREIPSDFADDGRLADARPLFGHRPETDYEAMMVGDDDSLEGTLELRDHLLDLYDEVLDPRERFVCDAYWFEKKSLRDIAIELNMTHVNVHYIVKAARKKLRVALQGLLEGREDD